LGPGQVLLDLACGQGAPGLWLARQIGCDLVGIDFAEAGLRLARENAAALLRRREPVSSVVISPLPGWPTIRSTRCGAVMPCSSPRT